MEHTQPSSKLGAGIVQKMGRTGFVEISRYLYAFPDNAGPVEDSGGSGNQVSTQIQSTKGFDARAQDAFQQSKIRGPAQKEPELER